MSQVDQLTHEKVELLDLKRSSAKDLQRAVGLHDGHAVLESFPGFHSDPTTVGKAINPEVVSVYNKARNKMILTGRDEALRSDLIDRMNELGLDMPNFGLKLFPGGSSGIKNFKSQTILDSIKENDWRIVHFYEDRLDWLNAAKSAVAQAYPDVKFVAHHISNIKDSLSLKKKK